MKKKLTKDDETWAIEVDGVVIHDNIDNQVGCNIIVSMVRSPKYKNKHIRFYNKKSGLLLTSIGKMFDHTDDNDMLLDGISILNWDRKKTKTAFKGLSDEDAKKVYNHFKIDLFDLL
jgi:hypothetical protein